VYAHASALLVSAGQRVEAGQVIARVGASGNASGPHLHFEVRVNDRPRNPLVALGGTIAGQ
ncbi:MAG: M23 family metallopeptidase, partial [Clostridia bacterium]|nr:M23 family metallopeptidase [Clostridia bacterium]